MNEVIAFQSLGIVSMKALLQSFQREITQTCSISSSWQSDDSI